MIAECLLKEIRERLQPSSRGSTTSPLARPSGTLAGG